LDEAMTESAQGRETIHVRVAGPAAWIMLDRPPLNVLDIATMRQLDRELAGVLQRSNPCEFVILQGAGPKGFSAGAEVADHAPGRVGEMLEAFHACFRRLWRSDAVTIAAVQGHCLGGGMELATFCDFVVAAESAKFGQPEIKLGCFPPVAVVMFPHLAGPRAALDLILTGRTISAVEAKQLGLVSRVVPDAQLGPATESLLEELSARSAAVLGLTRRALLQQADFDFENRLREVEEIYLGQLMQTADAQEGIRAFLEKRQPVWAGK
jgi:cyclohexa-1,5-dienecarbonyl-CoA hydratase